MEENDVIEEIPAKSFTIQEFYRRVVDFRAEFSKDEFWRQTEIQRTKKINDLSVIYLNCVDNSGKPLTPSQESRISNVYYTLIHLYNNKKEDLRASYG